MPKRYATAEDLIGPDSGPTDPPAGIAREFRDLDADIIDRWLVFARQWIGLQRWGARTSDAHALLTAHFLTIAVGPSDDGGAEIGPLSGDSLGPASRSFATAIDMTDEALSTSTYGRLFLAMRKVIRGRGSGVIAR